MISVIIPCYNQGQFLDETLQSVYNQKYTNWECLIINDGATDDTSIIGQKWAEKDDRFVYIEKQNGGRSTARNLGLDKAKGDFIQFLDSDDVLHELKFEEAISEINKNNSDLVITNFLRFKKTIDKPKRAFCKLEEQTFNYDSVLLNWEKDYTIPIHCGLFRFSKINTIRFDLRLNAFEDWFFWISFFKTTPKVSFINKNYAFYRIHPGGTCQNQVEMEKNHLKAKTFIFQTLDDNYKELFFNRFVKELSETRLKFRSYKDNVFYRKLFYAVKNKIIK